MLCGIHDPYSVAYFLDDRRDFILPRKNEKHVLLNPVNTLKLSRLEFKLVFEDLENEDYIDFLTTRNKNFKMAGLELFSSYFQAMPRTDYRHILRDVVLHELMSIETFQMMYAVIDSRTVGLLAVK